MHIPSKQEKSPGFPLDLNRSIAQYEVVDLPPIEDDYCDETIFKMSLDVYKPKGEVLVKPGK